MLSAYLTRDNWPRCSASGQACTCQPIPLALAAGSDAPHSLLPRRRLVWITSRSPSTPFRHTRTQLGPRYSPRLCTARCQPTILPLNHPPFICHHPPNRLRRHAIPETLQGATHEALCAPPEATFCSSKSKPIQYLVPTSTHMVCHPRLASCQSSALFTSPDIGDNHPIT